MSRGGWATISDDVASIRDSAQQMSQKPANATDQFQTVNYDSDLTVQHPHGTASIETRRSNLSGQRQGAPEMETRRSNLSGQRPGALEDGTAAGRGAVMMAVHDGDGVFLTPACARTSLRPHVMSRCSTRTTTRHLGWHRGVRPLLPNMTLPEAGGAVMMVLQDGGVRTQLRGLLLRRLSRRPRRRGPPRSRHVRPFTTNSLWLQQS